MTNKPGAKPKFCSECGNQLRADALFCHSCGVSIDGRPAGARPASAKSAMLWAIPAFAIGAIVMLTVMQMGPDSAAPDAGTIPLDQRATQAPDISSMSPEERADRLFNRVMRLSSEGKNDSAAFFSSMAFGALEALTPLDLHRRYDMGLVALVTRDLAKAKAQGDSILKQHPTHLLGLSLAARVADARGDAAAATRFRQRLLAAEPAERVRALKEYTDHESDVRAAVELARKR